jgi:hypothetical protein
MELFLNLVWLTFALAALVLWRARWAAESRAARSHAAPWRQWTAFGSAALLLFFAISLSDDLRIDSTLLDESSSGRRHSLNAELHSFSSTTAPYRAAGAPPAILVAAFTPPAPLSHRANLSTLEVARVTACAHSAAGRSPPAPSHA